MTSKQEEQAYDDQWSRLLASIGKEALQRMQSASILLVGMSGLGIEIAKNIVLMGVNRMTLHDDASVSISDLSSQFYLSESDVGKNRAECCLKKLTELNDRVKLSIHKGKIDEKLVGEHSVVVFTNNTDVGQLCAWNEFCHTNGIRFIAADTHGVFGWVFTDFGEDHLIVDKNGEQPQTFYVESITQDAVGLVTVADEERHDLEDDNVVHFTEVEGMGELNGKDFKVKVITPFQFSIGDTSNFKAHTKGGFVQAIKQPAKMSFKTLRQTLSTPPGFFDVMVADEDKLFAKSRHLGYFLYFQALLAFQGAHNGHLPRPGNDADAHEVIKLSQSISDSYGEQKFDVDQEFIVRMSKTAAGDLSPMCAAFGGIVGQEILKGVSSKYTPINGFFFMDHEEILPEPSPSEADVQPRGSRYDGQIAVFGDHVNQQFLNARYFLVGCGAIGCEMLKNWAMMGIGCGPNGQVISTDPDHVEISNLNRQFLYRQTDVTFSKSERSAAAVTRMNPNMKITAMKEKVMPATEDIFDDSFFEGLDGIMLALDNVSARQYMDQRAIFYMKPLMDSGTLGSKGNAQVVIPSLTESYSSSSDPPEKGTPMCLLHQFPNNIQHCLQWARENVFEGAFATEPEVLQKYIEGGKTWLDGLPPTSRQPALDQLHQCLVAKPVQTFDDCIMWAREEYEERYVRHPSQLLYTFPLDAKDSKSGAPFWSGAKRPPTPLPFDPNEPMCVDFVVAGAFLRAYCFGILDSEFKPSDIEKLCDGIAQKAAAIKPSPWKPKSGMKFSTRPDEEVKPEIADDTVLEQRASNLPSSAILKALTVRKVDFEKDDDRNFHVDFITAASNLRATSYKIPPASRLQSKLIAGRIIPAMITTTAAVTGFICLELYKILQRKNFAAYRNSFINLAIPIVQLSEPIKAAKSKYLETEFTLWDRIEIKLGDITLQRFLDEMKERGLDVEMISCGQALIYSSFSGSAKQRLPQRLTELIPVVSKKPLLPKQRHFALEVTACDLEGEDVDDLPPVIVYFK